MRMFRLFFRSIWIGNLSYNTQLHRHMMKFIEEKEICLKIKYQCTCTIYKKFHLKLYLIDRLPISR